MSKWFIELIGDKFDLEELRQSFPDGEVFVVQQSGNYFLAGQAFELLSNAGAVRHKAFHRLKRFIAITFLLNPNFGKPHLGQIIRETDDGHRESYVFAFASGILEAGNKLRASATVPPSSPVNIVHETQAQKMAKSVAGSPRLEAILEIWIDSLRSWNNLYRILEEIENYLEKHVDQAGLCTGNERERFVRSANSAEVSGIDSRHASRKYNPPKNPMNREEAERFVRGLLLSVFRNASDKL